MLGLPLFLRRLHEKRRKGRSGARAQARMACAEATLARYGLRHSFVTRVVTVSGIGVAQRLAGHKKITTTAMYLAVTDEDL